MSDTKLTPDTDPIKRGTFPKVQQVIVDTGDGKLTLDLDGAVITTCNKGTVLLIESRKINMNYEG